MLYSKLSDCIYCNDISTLINDIDCKIVEVSKSLYNNTIYMLNKNVDLTNQERTNNAQLLVDDFERKKSLVDRQNQARAGVGGMYSERADRTAKQFADIGGGVGTAVMGMGKK